MAADRDLLFGLLALQNGLINQVQLVAAFQGWTLDRTRSLADHLVARGDIEVEDRVAVDVLVGRHLKKHGGHTEASLAAIPAGRSMRERLSALGDAELSARAFYLGSDSQDEAERTTTYASGKAAVEGDRFRVLRPHARGGLGAVFVALDAELNREVALKQILDGFADDPVGRQRFLIEAEITGGLEHPGIVPVYGLGTDKDGRPYYAMRFIRGDSLKEAIERFHSNAGLKTHPGRRVLELRKLLRRFLDVCNAIGYAHSRGVLHRDIKPSNVVLGKHGETIVVDWGLARVGGRPEVGSPADERSLVPISASGSVQTLPGRALGTPAYMSPEQARGDLEALGPRSDVYSLGATLYYILCARAPFEGDVGAILRKVEAGDFPRPRKVKPTTDPALEAICLKAMATDPAARYASARELAEDVERWSADEPVSAYREPLRRKLARWGRQHQPLVAVGLTVLILSVAGLAVSNSVIARQKQITEKALADSEAAVARSRLHFKLAGQTVYRLLAEVSHTKLNSVPGMERVRKQMTDLAIAQYGHFLRSMSADREIVSDGRKTYEDAAVVRWQLGDIQGARLAYETALNLAQQLANLGLDDAALRRMASSKAKTDRDSLARAYLDRLPLLTANRDLAIFLYDSGHDAEAQPYAKTAARLANDWRTQLPGLPVYVEKEVRRTLGWSDARIGVFELERGQLAEAKASYERAIELLGPLVADKNEWFWYRLFVGGAHRGLGRIAREEGRAEAARREFAEAERIARAVHAERPEEPEPRNELAETLMVQAGLAPSGDIETGLKRLDEAMALSGRSVTDFPGVVWYRRDRAEVLFQRARLLAAAGRDELAEKDLAETLQAFRDLSLQAPDDATYPGRVGRVELALGQLRLRQGRGGEGRSLLEAAKTHLERACQLRPHHVEDRLALDEASRTLKP